jgi:hypothetical protein
VLEFVPVADAAVETEPVVLLVTAGPTVNEALVAKTALMLLIWTAMRVYWELYNDSKTQHRCIDHV